VRTDHHVSPATAINVRISDYRPGTRYVRTMSKAIWNDEVIAESDDTVIVEGKVYFPRSALRDDVLVDSDTHTVCPWKGKASYYTLKSNGHTTPDAVWFYPEPKPDASAVRDRVAFWKDVRIEA
jgi:uncharacterized protein (DUF427 family)